MGRLTNILCIHDEPMSSDHDEPELGYTITILDVLQLPHVDSSLLRTSSSVDFLVGEKSIEYYIVVNLWDVLGETVVLFEETQQLRAWSVHSHIPGVETTLMKQYKNCVPTQSKIILSTLLRVIVPLPETPHHDIDKKGFFLG